MLRINLIFLIYMFGRMEASFPLMRALEETPGERGFQEFSVCHSISDQLQIIESPTGVIK